MSGPAGATILLQCSAPFSPVTGPRLIVRPDIDVDDGRSAVCWAGP